jgi:hypothetical protein
MKWSSVVFGSVVALLGLAVPSNVSAAAITGHIGFGGSIVYDTRLPPGAGLATLDFYDELTGLPDATAGDGQVLKLGPNFLQPICAVANCITGYANIKDLTNDPTDAPAAGPSTLVIAGVNYGPAGIANFISAFTDPDAAGLHFDLTELRLQPGALCTGNEGLGDKCVEGPFALEQTAAGIHVSFDVFGYFRRPGDEGYYSGAFTTTFGGLTFKELFNRLDNTGQDLMCGTNNLADACTMDANFDPFVVPEPASMLTFGAGAAVLAMVRRRRAAKAAIKA